MVPKWSVVNRVLEEGWETGLNRFVAGISWIAGGLCITWDVKNRQVTLVSSVGLQFTVCSSTLPNTLLDLQWKSGNRILKELKKIDSFVCVHMYACMYVYTDTYKTIYLLQVLDVTHTHTLAWGSYRKSWATFFSCELETADEGECGGRWNQLLCYPWVSCDVMWLVSLLTKWPTTICCFSSVLSSNSLWKEEILAAEIHQRLQRAYGSVCMDVSSVWRWVKHFKDGKTEAIQKAVR